MATVEQMEHKLTFGQLFFENDNDIFFKNTTKVEENIYSYKNKYYMYSPELFDTCPYEVKRTISPDRPDIYWSLAETNRM